MDARTSAALEASIAHWNDNIAATSPGGVRNGPEFCALCHEFNHGDDECAGCPVRAKTGRRYCYGTPYNAAGDALYCWEVLSDDDARAARARARWIKRATAMRDFLVSLREVKP